MYDIFIQYIQPKSLGIQEGEFAVSRNLLVDLWLKFREYNGDFVVLTGPKYLSNILSPFLESLLEIPHQNK